MSRNRRRKRDLALLGIVLALSLPARGARAGPQVSSDPIAAPREAPVGSPGDAVIAIDTESEREARIQAIRAERDGIRLAGPTAVVAVGAAVLQGGLSTIVGAQYNCSGYWDCSDETRWAITAGSGAAIVVGAITLAFSAPVLLKRLRARRALSEEINRIRTEAPDARVGRVRPAWTLGLDVTGERKDFRLILRY